MRIELALIHAEQVVIDFAGFLKTPAFKALSSAEKDAHRKSLADSRKAFKAMQRTKEKTDLARARANHQ